VIFKRSLTLHHIRAKRKNPGLGHQHLMAVNALAQISGAKVEGNVIGSQKLTFIPGEVCPGDYHFPIGTAGSVTLLLQALLLPLCLSQKGFRLILEGGTHVPWSPPYHYLSEILFPILHFKEVESFKWRSNPVHLWDRSHCLNGVPSERFAVFLPHPCFQNMWRRDREKKPSGGLRRR
jgi:RNA 3'-terminal phosphate cyclase